jgi:immune inhibitor A
MRAAGVQPPPGFELASRSSPAPATGSLHLLVVLAEFADLPHRIAPDRFEELLFGAGESVLRYYEEVSRGLLALSGDLHGWVELPQSQLYYTQNARGIGPYPNNGQKMAEDAVAAALGAGLDLARYDADEDGVVDALLVIHSGQGWEWAGGAGNSPSPDPASMVSHKWVLPNQQFVAGAPRVADYFTCPELQLVRLQDFPAWADSISTIGVYCHELGHILGLPDYYDAGAAPLANHLGVWDLMDYGNWNHGSSLDPFRGAPGGSPAHFSAWSRMFLGWAEPDVLAPGAGEGEEAAYRLGSASSGAEPLQLLPNPGGVDWANGAPGKGEFFLAEVRTREGYDAGLPGEGLLLYHVDESRPSNRASQNAGGGRLLRLLPRDGETSIGPPSDVESEAWPGPGESRFDDSSDPSSRLHDGSSSGVALTGILPLDASSTVTLSAEVLNLRADLPVPFARPNPWRPSSHGDVRLVLTLSPGGAEEGTEVLIFDLAGRRVRALGSAAFLAGNRLAIWDGLAEGGTRAPAGTYFFRFQGPSRRSGTGRVTLVR